MSHANRYYRTFLSGDEKSIYDAIEKNWLHQKKRFTIAHRCIDEKIIGKVIVSIIKDEPELFWINYYSYCLIRSFYRTEMKLTFFFSKEEIRRFLTEANSWRNMIISKIPCIFSERNKIWLIYDYLSRQVNYGEGPLGYTQTIIGPMSRHNNHRSVCEGIAKSFKFLCDRSNIWCIVVFGHVKSDKANYEDHAWNIVECEGRYWHIDVTSEIEYAHFYGKASIKDFLRDDTEMKEYRWEKLETPVCM